MAAGRGRGAPVHELRESDVSDAGGVVTHHVHVRRQDRRVVRFMRLS